jgi:hypothetical protein
VIAPVRDLVYSGRLRRHYRSKPHWLCAIWTGNVGRREEVRRLSLTTHGTSASTIKTTRLARKIICCRRSLGVKRKHRRRARHPQANVVDGNLVVVTAGMPLLTARS